MEDSFKVRVSRIFNSDQFTAVLPSASTDSSLRSLWCLTDDEVEKKEWNRDKGVPEPESPPLGRRSKGPADYRRQLEQDLEDLEDGDLEDKEESGSSSQVAKPDDYDDEEWEIKSSIGRDCTLDYEEEEDQYDKVAVGREKAGDRIFMHEINGYGIDIDHGDELPVSFRDATKDPRANHMAAKIRLQEDEEEATGNIDPLEVSKPSTQAVGTRAPEGDLNVKSILKRKDQADPKRQKRVRFDPQFIEDSPAESEDVQMESSPVVVRRVSAAPSGDFSSAVPDYINNPSRYTQYVLDSSDDMDEQANRKACFDFLNSLKSSNSSDVAPAELPKSVTFVPRKKSEAAKSRVGTGADKEEVKRAKASLVSIDDEDNQEDEACAMEEDETESSHGNGKSTSHRAGRQYRMKTVAGAASDVDDD